MACQPANTRDSSARSRPRRQRPQCTPPTTKSTTTLIPRTTAVTWSSAGSGAVPPSALESATIAAVNALIATVGTTRATRGARIGSDRSTRDRPVGAPP